MDRPITCGICQKRLDPATDAVTFMGVGRWRDGPGSFLALCAAPTPDGQPSPCVRAGTAWATERLGQTPVFLSYGEWKVRPVHRSVIVTRSPAGRYDVQLTEWHLNSFYFLDRVASKKVEKVKQVLREWQAKWDIDPGTIPDIDRMEREAAQKAEPSKADSLLERLKASREARKNTPVEMPNDLRAELDRHSQTHLEHLRANVLAGGDDCQSCQIMRGLEKLHVLSEFAPILAVAQAMAGEAAKNPALPKHVWDQLGRTQDEIHGLLCRKLNLKRGDEKHNEEARRKNEAEMGLARTLLEKHGARFQPRDEVQPDAAGKPARQPKGSKRPSKSRSR